MSQGDDYHEDCSDCGITYTVSAHPTASNFCPLCEARERIEELAAWVRWLGPCPKGEHGAGHYVLETTRRMTCKDCDAERPDELP